MATELKHTIKSSGGDFTSLSAAVDHLEASHSNLVTADVYALLEIQDSFEDTSAVTVHNITTDATRYVEIYTLAAARHAGEWDEAKYHLHTTNATCVYIGINHAHFVGIQFLAEHTTGGYGQSYCIHTSADYFGGFIADRCITRGITASSADGWIGFNLNSPYQSSSPHARVQNCVLYCDTNGWSRTGINIASSYVGDIHIYNSTFKTCETGVNQQGDTNYSIRVKNCGFISCTNDFGGTITEVQTNSETTPTLKAGTSFHLDSTDMTWKDQGTDLSADSGIINSLDVDGETRSGTWDIGADEYVSGGTPINVSDSGIGTDTPSVKVKATVSDSGAGTDGTPQILAKIPIFDSGSGAEVSAILVKIGILDAGAGVDALAQILGRISILDSGLGADILASIKVLLAVLDSGIGVDMPSVKNAFSIQDSGIGADIVSTSSPIKTVIDQGAGADALSIKNIFSILDSGVGLDAAIVNQFKAISDAGIGQDILLIKRLVSILDTGLGAELFSILARIAVQDIGLAAEIVSVFKGEILPTVFGYKKAAAGLPNRTPAGLKRTAGSGLRRDA